MVDVTAVEPAAEEARWEAEIDALHAAWRVGRMTQREWIDASIRVNEDHTARSLRISNEAT